MGLRIRTLLSAASMLFVANSAFADYTEPSPDRAAEVARRILTRDTASVIFEFAGRDASIEAGNRFSDFLHEQHGRLREVTPRRVTWRTYDTADITFLCSTDELYELRLRIAADGLAKFTLRRLEGHDVLYTDYHDWVGSVARGKMPQDVAKRAELFLKSNVALPFIRGKTMREQLLNSRAHERDQRAAESLTERYIVAALYSDISYELLRRFPPSEDRLVSCHASNRG